jgi:hypothetical protein
LSDIVNHILPNVKTAKSKFASQTNKYDKFKGTIFDFLSSGQSRATATLQWDGVCFHVHFFLLLFIFTKKKAKARG